MVYLPSHRKEVRTNEVNDCSFAKRLALYNNKNMRPANFNGQEVTQTQKLPSCQRDSYLILYPLNTIAVNVLYIDTTFK